MSEMKTEVVDRVKLPNSFRNLEILQNPVYFNSIDTIRSVPTQATSKMPEALQEKPYINANIEVLQITPDYPIPIKFSSKYVLTDTQNYLRTIDSGNHTGVDSASHMRANMDIKGIITDIQSPIILEKWEDDEGSPFLMVADGNNRLYYQLTNYPSHDYQVIVIDNIAEKYHPPYDPVDISEVRLVTEAPPLNERRKFTRHYNKATYQDNRPDFSIFGSQGPRSTIKERIENSSYRRLTPDISDSKLDSNLMDKIRNGFDGYAPPPPDSITSPKLEQGLPEIVGFQGIIPICNSLGAAVFDIKYSQETQGTFKALTVSSEEYTKHAVRGVCLLGPTETNLNFSGPTTLAGEFRITKDISRALNGAILDSDINIPELKLASSSNPLSQEVSGFRIWKENSRYYSVVVLELENGQEIPIVLNRHGKDHQDKDVSGSVFVISDDKNNRIMTYHMREMIGLMQLETPRMFGFDLDRLAANVGAQVTKGMSIYRNLEIQNSGLDNSKTNFYFCSIIDPWWEIITQSTANLYRQTIEIDTPGKLSPRTIHNHIIDGGISDSITIASLTLGQILNKELVLNSDLKDHSIIMESFFDPFIGPRLTLPRLPISAQDPRTYQFTDLGKSINVLYPRFFDQKSFFENIPTKTNLITVPIKNLQDMIINGQIDHTSIAHLSTMLRRHEVWNFRRPPNRGPY